MGSLEGGERVYVKSFSGKQPAEFSTFRTKFVAMCIDKEWDEFLLADPEVRMGAQSSMGRAEEEDSSLGFTPVSSSKKKKGGAIKQEGEPKGGGLAMQSTLAQEPAQGGGEDKINRKIYAKLAMWTEKPALDTVKKYERTMDGRAAWRDLVRQYELSGMPRRASEHAKLAVLKLHPARPVEFFTEYETITGNLADMGEVMNEDARLGTAMGKMTEEYATLRTVLEATEGLTYDLFKERVMAFYYRQQASTEARNAALAAQFNGVCRECGEFGHMAYQCPQASGGGGRGGRGGGRGGKHHGGRGAGRGGQGKFKGKCNHCRKPGHMERDCRQLKREQAQEANAAIEVALAATERGRDPASRTDMGATWVVDSGSTTHMVQSSDGLTDVRQVHGEVVVANNQVVQSTGVGRMAVILKDAAGRSVRATMYDVLVVPELGRNLLSVKRITCAGGSVSFGPGKGTIKIGDAIIPIRQSGALYELNVRAASKDQDQAAANVAIGRGAYLKWHQRLGHRNAKDIARLGKLDVGVPADLRGEGECVCDACEVAKHTHASFPRSGGLHRAKKPLELAHTDLETMDVPSIGGARYAIGFTDDATRWLRVYYMKTKDEALKYLKQYVADMSGMLKGKKLQALRSDNGGEYVGGLFEAWCKEQGIMHTCSGPQAPQQNGVAERMWRTVVEGTRSLLVTSGLGPEFWAEAMNTMVYLINRMPSSALNGDTPFHALFGKHAKLSHLKIFGCRAYAHVYDNKRRKLDDKAWRGIMVGYDEHNTSCYRIFDPARGVTLRTVHVTFAEDVFPGKEAQESQKIAMDVAPEGESDPPKTQSERHPDGQQQPVSTGQTVKTVRFQSSPVGGTGDAVGQDAIDADDGQDDGQDAIDELRMPHVELVSDADDEGPVGGPVGARTWKQTEYINANLDRLGRGHRISQPNRQYTNLTVHYAYVSAESTRGDPDSYWDAMQSRDKALWQQAMDEEYQSLMDSGTWTLCELPPGANLIGSRWVFKTKRNETGKIVRHKARFVVQGCFQLDGRDVHQTFAPVAKLSSMRVVFAISTKKNWELDNMDVVTAFVQSPVDEDVYVRQPKGYERRGRHGQRLVCKLKKSLYGLRQAPRNWWVVINDWLIEYGLVPSGADPCVYVMFRDDDILVIILYVDDLILAGSSRKLIDQFKRAISERFNMKDLGALRWVLGMEVRRDLAARTLELSQTAYVDQVLERYGMAKCQEVGTPAEGTLTRLPKGEGSANHEYMSVVGSLLYAAEVSRPDIAYPVRVLGRHLQASGREHMTAAKRVLRYLKGTRELGIVYGGSGANSLKMVGYSDADWAGDKETRRSTTAYVFMLAGGCVSWGSKLQPTVALSSAEAEYMAACSAAQEAIHLRRLMESLGFQQDEATTIHEDNQGCIAMSENPVQHQRTKHIDIRYHFVRERVESGDIKLTYVGTEHQLADLLTKPLNRERVQKLRASVMGNKR